MSVPTGRGSVLGRGMPVPQNSAKALDVSQALPHHHGNLATSSVLGHIEYECDL